MSAGHRPVVDPEGLYTDPAQLSEQRPHPERRRARVERRRADALPGDTVRARAAAGASGIGGCRGLGPAAIRAVAGALG